MNVGTFPFPSSLSPFAATTFAALGRCTQMRRLSLLHQTVTAEHLQTLLPNLSLLETLELVSMDELRSLRFLSAVPHLASTLLALWLRDCVALCEAELLHVQLLTALSDLHVDRSFRQPLGPFIQAAFSPIRVVPALRLTNPNLHSFVYVPREEA